MTQFCSHWAAEIINVNGNNLRYSISVREQTAAVSRKELCILRMGLAARHSRFFMLALGRFCILAASSSPCSTDRIVLPSFIVDVCED